MRTDKGAEIEVFDLLLWRSSLKLECAGFACDKTAHNVARIRSVFGLEVVQNKARLLAEYETILRAKGILKAQ